MLILCSFLRVTSGRTGTRTYFENLPLGKLQVNQYSNCDPTAKKCRNFQLTLFKNQMFLQFG